VLECVDESNSEIWDWRRKIEIRIALRRDLERKIEIKGVVENFDGDMRAITRSRLALQRRSRCHAGDGDEEIKLDKKRGGWVRIWVFE